MSLCVERGQGSGDGIGDRNEGGEEGIKKEGRRRWREEGTGGEEGTCGGGKEEVGGDGRRRRGA